MASQGFPAGTPILFTHCLALTAFWNLATSLHDSITLACSSMQSQQHVYNGAKLCCSCPFITAAEPWAEPGVVVFSVVLLEPGACAVPLPGQAFSLHKLFFEMSVFQMSLHCRIWEPPMVVSLWSLTGTASSMAHGFKD